MRRRVLLASSAGLFLPSLVPGCQRKTTDLTLTLPKGSIPAQLIQIFRRQQARGTGIGMTTQDSLLDIHRLLEVWQGKAGSRGKAGEVVSWAAQTDAWVEPNQRQELIQPIDPTGLSHWSDLHPLWLQLLQRNRQGLLTPGGPVWGIPYRWTGLAIVYDRSKLPGQISLQNWADLLQPALQHQIMLPDQPRLVLGLGLKALGASANQEDPRAVNGLEDFLTHLHRQVRWYDSQNTLKALIKGDALAVVTWLDGIVPVIKQYPNLGVAIPPQGTLISADLWVRPKQNRPPTALAMAWLNFCLSPAFTEPLAIYGHGLSPQLWGASPEQIPPSLKSQAGLFSALSKSEFLYPLSGSAQASYQAFWQRIGQKL